MEVGSMAEWANAVLAIVAVITAVLVYRREKHRDREAEKERMKQDRLREEEYARADEKRQREEPGKLSLWIAAINSDMSQWGVVANNQSNHPFYKLRIKISTQNGMAFCNNINTLPPGRFFSQKQSSGEISEDCDFSYAVELDEKIHKPMTAAKRVRILSYEFFDNSGICWQVADNCLSRKS